MENILIIVAISYYGTMGAARVGMYSHCVNIARDLLTSLHNQALDVDEKVEAEGEEDYESEENDIILKGKNNI